MIPDDLKSMATSAAKTALAGALMNPTAGQIAQQAGERLLQVQQAASGRQPSAMHHYAWGAGLGTVSVLNFYAAYRLPSGDKWLKAYLVLTGAAAGAGAYVNINRARTLR